MRRLFVHIDLTAWDNWLPLSVIGIFVVLGAVAGAGVFGFGLTPGDVDRFTTVYTDIGIQTTAGIFAIVISLSLVAICWLSAQMERGSTTSSIPSVATL